MNEPKEGFARDTAVDDPGIIGARWWNRALTDEASAVSRREAMKTFGWVAGLGAVALGGACVVGVIAADDDTDTRQEPSLAAQRRFGWNVGARGERLSFPVETLHEPFDTAALARDLTPVAWRHVYQPTLLEAPDATPRESASEENLAFVPLRQELVAGLSPASREALAQGLALARIFAGRDARAALVIDLPGPEAVAFAAGLASVFEPVLMISNWPHPRGVVGSHLTLAAALKCHYYFHEGRARRRAGAPPCFVLDRSRLAPAVSAEQFDNRFLASLPSAATLRAGGVERVLYVVPTDLDVPELDDLNEDLVAYASAGLDVRALTARIFWPDAQGNLVYGADPAVEAGFWLRYPWSTPSPEALVPAMDPRSAMYRPARRPTTFSRAASPAGFGTVALVVSGAVVLGAAFDRRGSWHRTGSSWGGG